MIVFFCYIHRRSSVRRFVGSSVRRFVDSSVRLFVSSSVCRFVSLLVRQFVGSSVRRFIGLSVRRSTFIFLTVDEVMNTYQNQYLLKLKSLIRNLIKIAMWKKLGKLFRVSESHSKKTKWWKIKSSEGKMEKALSQGIRNHLELNGKD